MPEFRAEASSALLEGQISGAGVSGAGSDLGQGEDDLASQLLHVDLEGVLVGSVLDDVVVHVEQHPGRGHNTRFRTGAQWRTPWLSDTTFTAVKAIVREIIVKNSQ